MTVAGDVYPAGLCLSGLRDFLHQAGDPDFLQQLERQFSTREYEYKIVRQSYPTVRSFQGDRLLLYFLDFRIKDYPYLLLCDEILDMLKIAFFDASDT